MGPVFSESVFLLLGLQTEKNAMNWAKSDMGFYVLKVLIVLEKKMTHLSPTESWP